jgi:hypothetical protein
MIVDFLQFSSDVKKFAKKLVQKKIIEKIYQIQKTLRNGKLIVSEKFENVFILILRLVVTLIWVLENNKKVKSQIIKMLEVYSNIFVDSMIKVSRMRFIGYWENNLLLYENCYLLICLLSKLQDPYAVPLLNNHAISVSKKYLSRSINSITHPIKPTFETYDKESSIYHTRMNMITKLDNAVRSICAASLLYIRQYFLNSRKLYHIQIYSNINIITTLNLVEIIDQTILEFESNAEDLDIIKSVYKGKFTLDKNKILSETNIESKTVEKYIKQREFSLKRGLVYRRNIIENGLLILHLQLTKTRIYSKSKNGLQVLLKSLKILYSRINTVSFKKTILMLGDDRFRCLRFLMQNFSDNVFASAKSLSTRP